MPTIMSQILRSVEFTKTQKSRYLKNDTFFLQIKKVIHLAKHSSVAEATFNDRGPQALQYICWLLSSLVSSPKSSLSVKSSSAKSSLPNSSKSAKLASLLGSLVLWLSLASSQKSAKSSSSSAARSLSFDLYYNYHWHHHHQWYHKTHIRDVSGLHRKSWHVSFFFCTYFSVCVCLVDFTSESVCQHGVWMILFKP